jgi:hypothetical protein
VFSLPAYQFKFDAQKTVNPDKKINGRSGRGKHGPFLVAARDALDKGMF